MSKREIKLDKFGISRKRYKELCGFCEQYPEWKSALKDYSFIKGVSYDPSPKSITNAINSPVEDATIKMDRFISNCNIIEEAAKKADPENWEFIIDSACYELPINYLITVKGMNLSQFPFYKRRRYFFYILDQMKK